MPRIPHTSIDIFPLCLGGNVFGWTADEAQSFAVLDAFREGGGDFVDTADVYSAWVAGNQGGESEAILGRWLASRGSRDKLVIATKVGKLPGLTGLSARTIEAAVEASLRRLGTDYIDLYYAHADDAGTPLDESLRAFDALVRSGKVRHIAASNYDAARLSSALDSSRKHDYARFVALQPEYNLLERSAYEGALREVVRANELACFPYYALAKGFLTGKYRPGRRIESQRSAGAAAYLDARGQRVLAALDELAAQRHTTPTTLAIAWLRAQPTVLAPIASARDVQQVAPLLEGGRLALSPDEIDALSRAATP